MIPEIFRRQQEQADNRMSFLHSCGRIDDRTYWNHVMIVYGYDTGKIPESVFLSHLKIVGMRTEKVSNLSSDLRFSMRRNS